MGAITCKKTPARAPHFKPGDDMETIDAICERLGLGKDIDPDRSRVSSYKTLTVRRTILAGLDVP